MGILSGIALFVGIILWALKGGKKMKQDHDNWANGFSQVTYGWFLDNVIQVMGDPVKVSESDDKITYYYGNRFSEDVFYIVFTKGIMKVVDTVHFVLPLYHVQAPRLQTYTSSGRRKFEAKCMGVSAGMRSEDVMAIMGGEPYGKCVDLDCVVWEYVYGIAKDPESRRTFRVWLDLDERHVVDFHYDRGRYTRIG
ncbi:MAG: hypothetical protein HDQ88_04420 [Clostridia bacterium]|nr:hypothetical protein [Clostridia bacterium]